MPEEQDVIILSLAEERPAGGCGTGCCGADAAARAESPDKSGFVRQKTGLEPDADGTTGEHDCGSDACAADACGTDACATAAPRVPVLACRDALVSGGATVDIVTAGSDQEIDAVIARLDAPVRPDRLAWPAAGGPTLVLAVASDAQLRAIVRRMIRRYAPPPSRRPTDLPADRTIPDLPTIAILPLDPTRQSRSAAGVSPSAAGGGRPFPHRGPGGVTGGAAVTTTDARPDVGREVVSGRSGVAGGAVTTTDPRPDVEVDLADRLGLSRDPADVAKAVLNGKTRRLDVFRNDGGSVTVHGALLGGVDEAGNAVPWLARVELDDHILADGVEPVLAVAVANANGYAHLDELPLAPGADASSGTISVAVAVPVVTRGRFGRRSVRIEIRRATGRAVSVNPAGEVPFVDDGVAGVLTRKRTWWVEPGALPVATL